MTVKNISFFSSPIGYLRIVTNKNFVTGLSFHEEKKSEMPPANDTLHRRIHEQLHNYFRGNPTSFRLPLQPEGTSFQRSVWEKLLDIPCGQTITYLQLAKRLGDPKKVRAVGRANGQNPIALLIPCHRVIGAGGKLTGYGGGIHRKKWLLRHEGALLL